MLGWSRTMTHSRQRIGGFLIVLLPGRRSEAGAVPLSKPCVGVAASFDSTVLPDRRGLGRVDWPRPGGVRHSFATAHQAHVHLSTDQESPCGSAAAWHTKLESTVRYLGIEVDDALEIAEQTEV
jgi:hypothetical protein